jgi:hypothetical protein
MSPLKVGAASFHQIAIREESRVPQREGIWPGSAGWQYNSSTSSLEKKLIMKVHASAWLLVFLLSCASVEAQNPAPASKPLPAAQPVPLATTVPGKETPQEVEQLVGKSVAYTNSEIGFSFSYPAELHAQSAESLAAKWKQATDKSDPKYKATDACTHVLLHAERKDEPGVGASIAIYGEGHSPKTVITVPVAGSVTITEMNQQCLPAEFKGREDEVLSAFASSVGEEPGMKLIGQPMWYEVEGHKVHAGKARSAENSAKSTNPTAPPTDYLASATVNIGGHLMIFMFETQDLYSLNKLVHGTVQFGSGESKPLLPLSITD